MVFSLITLASINAYAENFTCRQGYVWREAFSGDLVCVKPETRARVASDNRAHNARIEPGGGPYGRNTCRQGYVWREARPGDQVCVTPKERDQTHYDNSQAANRRVKQGHGQTIDSGPELIPVD